MTNDQEQMYREYVHRHAAIFNDVVVARIAMDHQFGGITDFPLRTWLPMLVESLGEVGAAINDDGAVRAQVVRVAAVAIAIIDWIDRGSPVVVEQ